LRKKEEGWLKKGKKEQLTYRGKGEGLKGTNNNGGGGDFTALPSPRRRGGILATHAEKKKKISFCRAQVQSKGAEEADMASS